MATTIELKNSVTTGNSPSSLAQGEMGVNITDKKVWIGNASSTPIQLIGAGASMSLTSLTTSSDASISGLTVGKGSGSSASNTAVGASALTNSTSGSYGVTGFGYYALAANTSGNSIVAIGANALTSNTTGSSSVAIGHESLKLNTTASNNTAVGYQAGYSGTTSINNSYFGYQAAYNATSQQNTIMGSSAGYGITATGGITIMGYQAGYSAVGTGSTLIGYTTGYNSTGSQNTFVGSYNGTNGCGYLMTTGSKNTILGGYSGNQGGLDIRTASNYIVLSDGDGNPRGVFDNNGQFLVGLTSGAATGSIQAYQTTAGQWAYIAKSTASSGSTYFHNFLTSDNTQRGYIYYNGSSTVYSTSSDERLKENIVDAPSAINDISAVKIRSFDWIENKIHQKYGVIAQELQQVAPDAVSTPPDENGMLGVDYSLLVPMMIKAIQEQQALINDLTTRIKTLEAK